MEAGQAEAGNWADYRGGPLEAQSAFAKTLGAGVCIPQHHFCLLDEGSFRTSKLVSVVPECEKTAPAAQADLQLFIHN